MTMTDHSVKIMVLVLDLFGPEAFDAVEGRVKELLATDPDLDFCVRFAANEFARRQGDKGNPIIDEVLAVPNSGPVVEAMINDEAFWFLRNKLRRDWMARQLHMAKMRVGALVNEKLDYCERATNRGEYERGLFLFEDVVRELEEIGFNPEEAKARAYAERAIIMQSEIEGATNLLRFYDHELDQARMAYQHRGESNPDEKPIIERVMVNAQS